MSVLVYATGNDVGADVDNVWILCMGRGRVTSDETIERIKATYALNGRSIADTSRDLGIPESTVRKYISPDVKAEFAEVRAETMAIAIPEIVAKATLVQVALLESMADPDALRKASLQEKAVSFGIVTDKVQLLTGEATERHEHRNTSEARESFARRIDELAERRRTRQSASDAERTGS